MVAPNTKDWYAQLNKMPIGGPMLMVDGNVETPAHNLQPVLTEAEPQGINDKIQILDLSIEDNGQTAPQVVDYHPAHFEKPAKKGQYDFVTIRFEGEEIKTVKVVETH